MLTDDIDARFERRGARRGDEDWNAGVRLDGCRPAGRSCGPTGSGRVRAASWNSATCTCARWARSGWRGRASPCPASDVVRVQPGIRDFLRNRKHSLRRPLHAMGPRRTRMRGGGHRVREPAGVREGGRSAHHRLEGFRQAPTLRGAQPSGGARAAHRSRHRCGPSHARDHPGPRARRHRAGRLHAARQPRAGLRRPPRGDGLRRAHPPCVGAEAGEPVPARGDAHPGSRPAWWSPTTRWPWRRWGERSASARWWCSSPT